jgi:hypothetical protein
MRTILTLSFLVTILIMAGMVSTASCQLINPYGPYSAVAAEPQPPYNLDQIPQKSRTFYLPCPSVIPYADQLPDAPPFWSPIIGPFGLPVGQP